MGRGIKKENKIKTDFSITDAEKRIRRRRSQLQEAADATNPIDELNHEMETEGMSDYEKEIFED